MSSNESLELSSMSSRIPCFLASIRVRPCSPHTRGRLLYGLQQGHVDIEAHRRLRSCQRSHSSKCTQPVNQKPPRRPALQHSSWNSFPNLPGLVDWLSEIIKFHIQFIEKNYFVYQDVSAQRVPASQDLVDTSKRHITILIEEQTPIIWSLNNQRVLLEWSHNGFSQMLQCAFALVLLRQLTWLSSVSRRAFSSIVPLFGLHCQSRFEANPVGNWVSDWTSKYKNFRKIGRTI